MDARQAIVTVFLLLGCGEDRYPCNEHVSSPALAGKKENTDEDGAYMPPDCKTISTNGELTSND